MKTSTALILALLGVGTAYLVVKRQQAADAAAAAAAANTPINQIIRGAKTALCSIGGWGCENTIPSNYGGATNPIDALQNYKRDHGETVAGPVHVPSNYGGATNVIDALKFYMRDHPGGVGAPAGVGNGAGT